MITITKNTAPAATMHPNLVEGWDQSRPGRNQFYELLNGDHAVVLNSSGWRGGTLHMLFASRDDAQAAEQLHTWKSTFTYQDDTMAALTSMTYAVDGETRLYPVDSRRAWRLDVPFREL